MSLLLGLYLKLVSGVLVGWILGKILPPKVPKAIGVFLFWIGVPLSMIIFLRGADLSGGIWLSPLLAWLAIISGAILARGWIYLKTPDWNLGTQGSFIFASMFGNTGYLGYPIILALTGEKYFAWAIFYDLFGTTLGAYGLGGIFAGFFSEHRVKTTFKDLLLSAIAKPIWWAFAFSLWFRQIALSPPVEMTLVRVGWCIIGLSLILIGMRLSQLKAWQKWRSVSAGLIVKMLCVPLLFGFILGLGGVSDSLQLVLVLQVAMPPAFATLVVAETYDLDREIAVSSIAIGSLSLLVTLPLWMLLFGNG
ncbi:MULTISPECIES: AEC family transporter [Spirulina sp. CCY15215]|uniref:AEC family transporter n=1 Tax=Spirulina sp. CCY15215 TaxID=2767591 RepID=UPI001952976D|nr:AEC family transporter [Spirulina major]